MSLGLKGLRQLLILLEAMPVKIPWMPPPPPPGRWTPMYNPPERHLTIDSYQGLSLGCYGMLEHLLTFKPHFPLLTALQVVPFGL